MERVVNGQPVAYFDGPGGTQVPAEVADAIRSHLLEHNGNAGWNYATSHETDDAVAAARAAMADFFGGRPDEVAFGPNMTTLTLRLAHGLGRALEPGDRLVVTELDHHANVDPWKALERDRGAEIRVARMEPDTGALDPDDLLDAISERTRILAIGAASNALGTLTDLGPAVARAREVGATVFVDAVHSAAHRLPDVGTLGADFLAVSPYKFYGPHSGVLWGRNERIEELDLPRVASAPDHAPNRMETGTASFEALAGIAAAVDFLADLSTEGASGDRSRRARLQATYRALHDRAASLFDRLWHGLEDLGGVRLYGPPPGANRTATLAFTVSGVDPRTAAGQLSDQGLFLSHGDFYATTLLDRLGLKGTGLLRAGIMAYTTGDEVDRLIAAVGKLG